MAKGVNYYDGSQWVEVATVEDGSGTERPVKRWDGSQWVQIYPTSAIPDSVVSRTADNASNTRTGTGGLKFSTSQEWSEIQGRYSQNTANATKAYLTDTNQSVIDSVDVSGLTSGDVFTFSTANLAQNTSYYMYMDAEGASFTNGFYDNPTFPYTSSDGMLEITAGLLDGNEQNDGTNISCISEIGNINL